MAAIVIDSISSLLNVINNAKKQYPGAELFFRGQSEQYTSITPSIYRNSRIEKEDLFFKEYILRNPDEFKDDKTTFEKLVRMQHYKLPTRLLDITSNPLVALYFCFEEKPRKLGELILFVIKPERVKYYDSDTVSVVANVSRRPCGTLDISSFILTPPEDDKQFIKRFNAEDCIQYLLHEIKHEKPYFKDAIEKNHLECIWCVKPLLNNRRIIKQDGAFLLFGIKGDKSQVADFDSMIQVVKFDVHKNNQLRKDLSLLGITKDKVYPELDTTAEYLKETL